jgi:hypothetical protein
MKAPMMASAWCRRASIASMYPFGGPRLRDGPSEVQGRCKSTQFLHASDVDERSHLHLDFRH